MRHFYTMVKFIGISELDAHRFETVLADGRRRTYRVEASGDKALYTALGGRNKALNILRTVSMVTEQCCLEGHEDDFALIEPAFKELVKLYPMLTTYYERARLGSRFETWFEFKDV